MPYFTLVVDSNSLVVKSVYCIERDADVIFLSIASSFHVDHELVVFMPVGEPEYDEMIEEYDEEIFA